MGFALDNLALVCGFLVLLRYTPLNVVPRMLHRHSCKCRWRIVLLEFGVITNNALNKTLHRYAFCNRSNFGERTVQNVMFLACAAHVFEVSGLDSVARR